MEDESDIDIPVLDTVGYEGLLLAVKEDFL